MAVTPQTNTTLAEIAEIIRERDNFVICGHVSPDGDCLGSQLTLSHALKALGKTVTCVTVKPDPVVDSFPFLPGIEELVPAESFEGSCEVFIGVDVPNRERIGEAACAILDAATTSITLDHHACDQAMCEHVYVDPESASTTMLAWKVVRLLLEEPSIACAQCAFAGLMTDTGGFRFQNADAEAFFVGSDLVAHGAQPSAIATSVFQSRTIASLKLEAVVIDRMQLIAGGGAAISWITEADMSKVDAVKSDVEPLIDAVRSLKGISVACLLREQDGKVRGNLRAKDDTDVSVLARELGGGGHKAAAGFNVDLPIDECVEFVSGKISDLLN